ncbi:hypothetical protein [Petroclostridium sp. X23]|uniref:hypothetical protein n=1 Tax=Petroclostridium sp. X23 TaxID=3045146 RepID=UPI0024ADBABD|nr:hypothetical protein [Petroclostridium sp. X23]WHH57764.1 hypothetical protein QKW49_18350 [Petroclostridium sp. X23]
MKKKMLKKLSLLLVVAVVTCFTCATAFADSSSVTIYLDGNSIGTYTTSQLDAVASIDIVPTQTFSSHTCKGGFVFRSATGYELADVLNYALAVANTGKTTGDIDTIEFVGTDDYTSDPVSLDDVLTGKYFTAENDLSGDDVIAVIAKEYGSSTLSTDGCIRNVHGQQAAGDDTIEDWVRDLDKIYLTSN